MRYLTIILWLCLTTVCLAQTPVDFQKWQLDDTTFQVRIGDPIQNYAETDTSWAEIENDFVLIGDTMTARHAYMKTDVLPNGVSQISIEHNDTTYTITQRPIRLIWLKTDTWNWIDVVDTPSWGTPTVDSNIVKWTGVFPGVDYRVRKQKARVEHGIFFKPAFLDSAITLYDQRPDSLDIALGNVMEYTLSANIDNADIGMGNVNKRIFKAIGKHVFGMARSRLHFPGSDTLQLNLVNHRWVKQGSKIYCIEYIKMRVVKMVHEVYPTATIWHNASPTTIDGTTNVEDARVDLFGPNYNFGGSDELYVKLDDDKSVIRCKNVASELGGEVTDITDCTLYMYCFGGAGFPLVGAYRIFKPWVEGNEDGVDDDDGDVTWNDWASDANEWGTEGCLCANDGGVDNNVDDDACVATRADRKATAEDTDQTVTTSWNEWTMTDALAEGWYAGTINEEGVLLEYVSGTNALVGWRSTEYASEQPYWVFTYTTNGEPAAGQVIIIN